MLSVIGPPNIGGIGLIVVADASVLIGLSSIGGLYLIRERRITSLLIFAKPEVIFHNR